RVPSFQCQDYRGGALGGDLCEDLCEAGQLRYRRCLYYERGKKVLQADWRGRPVVLKSKEEAFSSFPRLPLLPPWFLPSSLAPSFLGLMRLQAVKNPPTMRETQVRSLSRENPRGKEMATQSSVLAWEIPWTEELGVHGVAKESDTTEQLHFEEMGEGWPLGAWGQRSRGRRHWFPAMHTPSPQATVSSSVSSSFFWRGSTRPSSLRPEPHAPRPPDGRVLFNSQVVAIDVDMAFFEPKMREILEQNCTRDEDCNFFDCFSKCDLRAHRCGAQRANSNLQV
ncbi:Protein FAM69C, partial [Bos mutus]